MTYISHALPVNVDSTPTAMPTMSARNKVSA